MGFLIIAYPSSTKGTAKCNGTHSTWSPSANGLGGEDKDEEEEVERNWKAIHNLENYV